MFNMFQGVVEDVNDELKIGRYRVRIFGVHTDNKNELPTSDLPWAVTMQSTMSAATSGIGYTTNLLAGSWVVCTFLDDEFQKPMILGSIAGINTDTALGFIDLPTEIDNTVPPQVPPSPVYQPATNSIIEQAYIGSLTLTNVSKLKVEIAKHETGGKDNPYAVENTIGFIGKYQFGAAFLEDMGYIHKGASKAGTNKFILSNAVYWTGKNNISSKEVFFTKIDIQEALMDEMLKSNWSIMAKANIVSKDTPQEKTAGLLCAAHLKGAGGAIKFARGDDTVDAYGTSCSKYYNYGYRAIAGVETTEFPTEDNLNQPAVDKNNNNTYKDARKYDTGAKKATNGQQGFADPSGRYPLKNLRGESDINRLARGAKTAQTIVGEKESDIYKDIPVANGSSKWSQSPIPYNTRYPKNHLYASESGHVMEFDDTEGNERINIHHKSGTFMETDSEGNQVNKIKGIRTVIVDNDELVYIKGNGHINVDGDISIRVGNALQIEVLGDANIKVNGNMKQEVSGDYELNVQGSMKFNSSGNAAITTSAFNLTAQNWMILTDPLDYHTYVMGDVVTGGASLGSLSPYSPSIRIPSPVSRQESIDMILEDNPEVAARVYANAPPVTATSKDDVPANEVLAVTGECGFTELSNELQLSTNYKLSDLCRDGGFNFNGQHGHKAEEIACNMKQLCINVLEPLKAKYSHLGFKINSGFRPAGSAVSHAAVGKISQHELGQAVDISFSKVRGTPTDRQEFFKLAQEIKNIVPFDQLLLEFTASGSVWIHISFTSGNLRRNIMTFNNHAKHSDGLTLLV